MSPHYCQEVYAYVLVCVYTKSCVKRWAGQDKRWEEPWQASRGLAAEKRIIWVMPIRSVGGGRSSEFAGL